MIKNVYYNPHEHSARSIGLLMKQYGGHVTKYNVQPTEIDDIHHFEPQPSSIIIITQQFRETTELTDDQIKEYVVKHDATILIVDKTYTNDPIIAFRSINQGVIHEDVRPYQFPMLDLEGILIDQPGHQYLIDILTEHLNRSKSTIDNQLANKHIECPIERSRALSDLTREISRYNSVSKLYNLITLDGKPIECLPKSTYQTYEDDITPSFFHKLYTKTIGRLVD